MPEYKVIRSDRKTVQLQVTPGGLTVRAPKRMSDREIARIVENHAAWIKKHTEQLSQAVAAAQNVPPLTPEELRELANRAMLYIPMRASYWAQRMGVEYNRITIRTQKTKWGSCSAKGNLNFNCLLMLAPFEAVDAIIVHELAHLKEMNHSPAFYAVVRSAYPEYDRWHGWLKANGNTILRRAYGIDPEK